MKSAILKILFLLLAAIVIPSSLANTPEDSVKVKSKKAPVDAPKIIADTVTRKVKYLGNTINITIGNIRVVDTGIQAGKTARAIKVWAGKPEFDKRMQAYLRLTGEPEIRLEGSTYTISFNVYVELPADKNKISGTIEMPVNAAFDRGGEKSDIVKRNVSVEIEYAK